MTEKLYYQDAYIKEFSATVISSEKLGEHYEILLDKTAFFPEEGGQYSDTGSIGDAEVISVREKDGLIYHRTNMPLAVDSVVECRLNFDERYEKMQCHSGEHILSGLFHSLYGLDNVGFHLGADEVTMDISAPLTRADLDRVEALANEVIYKNIPIVASFPSSSELENMNYRSKLDLKENVRLVTIGEYDICACCAPHVARTGEIGLIKILDFAKLRGGLRLFITAGRRAMRSFAEYYNSAHKISGMLSVPKNEIAAGVEKTLGELSALRAEFSRYRMEVIKKAAHEVPPTEENYIQVLEDATIEEMIAFSNIAISKVGQMLIVLTPCDMGYRYVISSESMNLRSLSIEINECLIGRGGGKPNMIQGSFLSSLDEIKEYFIPSP